MEKGSYHPSGAELTSYIPETDLCKSAFKLAESELTQPVLNHSLRVFCFAKWLAEKDDSEWASGSKLGLLFVSCICHDLGTSDHFNGDQRFEVEGADAAVGHLTSHGVTGDEAHQVWIAVALHTSPGIAERITELARLVRLGVLIDFREATRAELGAQEFAHQIEKDLPRLDIEKVLGDAVVQQAICKAHKAPAASWPGILLKSHLENPGWAGVNKAF